MNIEEIKQLISAADICGHVPLIKGVHGIGKSEAVIQHSIDQNMHYEPLILSLMDTGDLLGLPTEKVIGGVSSTLWAAPSWYTNIINAAWPENLSIDRLEFNDEEFANVVEKKLLSDLPIGKFINRAELNTLFCEYMELPDDCLQLARQEVVEYLDAKRSVLFLDEFNRANQDILNASLQLILEHRLHSHILPIVRGQETLIVAAINPTDGDYTVQEFDPALLDRFIECEAEPDLKSWKKWATANKVNKIVIDFLVNNEKKFHFTPKDGSKGASPRSWTKLGVFMDNASNLPETIITNYAKGTIGTALAAQFLHFYHNYSSMTSLKDVEKMIMEKVKESDKAGNVLNPSDVADTLSDKVRDLEVVRRSEFADSLINKYINKDDFKDAMPMLVFLYALPLENLSATLKYLQTDSISQYAALAKMDKAANNKGLFKKTVALAAA